MLEQSPLFLADLGFSLYFTSWAADTTLPAVGLVEVG